MLALDIQSKTFEDYVKIVSSLKDCNIYFPYQCYDDDEKFYQLTVEDVELLAKYDLKIAKMSSSVLNFKRSKGDPSLMVTALRT